MPKKAQKVSSASAVMSVTERTRRVAQLEKDANQLQKELLDMERRLTLVLKEQQEKNEADSLRKARKKIASK